MRPKLTVVTPSFNQGRFIERTIRSVLDQGYPNLEYVIVDGGSTDDTIDIVRRYEDQLTWWVSEPDNGQTEAINKGIDRTDGEIVAYLNSDDYYRPGALDRVVETFERSDRGWVAGAGLDLDEHDRPAGTPGTDATGIIRPSLPWNWEWSWPKGRQWWLLAPWHVPQPSAFWRRELFEGFGLFRQDMHFAFDAEFMLRLVLAGEMPELIEGDPLAVRVHHEEAKSSDFSHWKPEIEEIIRIHSPALTPRERRRFPATRMMFGAFSAGTAAYSVLPVRLAVRFRTTLMRKRPAAQVVFHRGLSRIGDLLDYIPARWRPAIRTRDRVRREQSKTREGLMSDVPPLRVCIDARLGAGRFGGVEQVVIGLAAALSRLEDGDEEYLFLTHPEHDEWIREYVGGPCRLLPARRSYPNRRTRAVTRALLERLPVLGIRFAVRPGDGTIERAGINVVHFPFQDAFTTDVPSIYQPHDLQHLHLPELFTGWERDRRERIYRTHCERAALVVAMTSWGRGDFIAQYGLPPEKVAVVPGGSVLREYPAPTPEDLDSLRARLSLADGFLLYPAQTWPHKNHERLLEALARIRDESGITIPLVCPGRQTRDYRRLRELVDRLGLAETTSFPGFVSTGDLRGLYELGTGLVFPSRFEGWGLPVCEAFDAGLPVASSTATGLPDIVGDAGLLFDPDDVPEMARQLERLWTDADLRADLRERGKRRAAQFSFDHTARLFRAHYRQIGRRALSEEDRILLASPPPA